MISPMKKILFFLLGATALLFPNNVFAQDAAKDLYDQGQNAVTEGNSAKAIEFYEKSIEANPDFAPAYSALGSVYLESSAKMDDVVWLFKQAAELEPQNVENYTNMCRAYFQSQQHDFAETACLKALEIDPNSGSAQLSLAWIYLLGKVEPGNAVKYFTAVIDKIPNNPKIYYGLGIAYARNNEQAKALDVITNLRSMGQESLASQLEKMIRPSAEVPMPTAGAIRPPVIEGGPSKVVKSRPVEPPKIALPPDPNAPPPGTIRIQLKARLPPTDPMAAKGPKKDDNEGYDTDDYKPLTLKQRQERVKRMRGSAGKMSGSGTVTSQTTAQ